MAGSLQYLFISIYGIGDFNAGDVGIEPTLLRLELNVPP